MDLTLKSNFLRTKGILTQISVSRRGANASNGLWVVIDNQYDDALACLENPDHQVVNLLDESEMQELESIAAQQYSKSISIFLVKAFLAIFAFILVVAIIYVRRTST